MADKIEELMGAVPEDKIDPRHLRFVVRALHEVGDRWDGMGSHMDVKDLPEIRQNYRGSGTRCLIAMADSLLRGRFNTQPGKPASWQTVVRAVHAPTGGNNPPLARRIANRLNAEYRAFYPGDIAVPVDTIPFIDDVETTSDATVTSVVSVLHNLLAPVAARWFEMGALLCLPLNTLTTIKNDPGALRDVDKLGSVISEWLKSDVSWEMENPCWQVLVDVVAHGAGGDDPWLAVHLVEKSKTVVLPRDPPNAPAQVQPAAAPNGARAQPQPQLVPMGTEVQQHDVGALTFLLQPIAAHWDLFLGQLGVPDAKRKGIATDNRGSGSDCKSCLVNGLRKLATSGRPPTYGTIAAVLDGSVIPNKPLAREIYALRRDNKPVIAGDVEWLVRHYLYKKAADWETFLGLLAMPRSGVREISGANNIAINSLADGLEYWVNVSDRPTYEQISQVLREPVVMNIPLARKVEEFAKERKTKSPVTQSPPPAPAAQGGGVYYPAPTIFNREPRTKEFNILKWRGKDGKEQKYRLRDAVAPEWRRLGETFGFGPGILKSISKTCRDDPVECWDEVVGRWLQDGSDPPEDYLVTWEALIKALDDGGGLGNEIKKLRTALQNQPQEF